MSLFEEKPATEQPAPVDGQNVAPQTDPQPQESFLEKLVQERGENWKDPEVLAKGKIEADSYIKTLEGQLEELRTDLSKQDYSAQLLEQLQSKASAPTADTNVAPKNNNLGGSTEGNTSLKEEDLQSLVEKALTERDQKATLEQNVSSVEKALSEKYGTDASGVVKQKAEELGLSLARMGELAGESPSAFMALVGEPAPAAPNMTQGSVRTESVGLKSNERDWAYYQNLRRENRSQYFSPQIQRQLMEDKKRLGEKFGN